MCLIYIILWHSSVCPSKQHSPTAAAYTLYLKHSNPCGCKLNFPPCLAAISALAGLEPTAAVLSLGSELGANFGWVQVCQDLMNIVKGNLVSLSNNDFNWKRRYRQLTFLVQQYRLSDICQCTTARYGDPWWYQQPMWHELLLLPVCFLFFIQPFRAFRCARI